MANDNSKVFIFGEVLFDCFPTGEEVLGGAPFNVAWHLQALGNSPCFISSVGEDKLGQKILSAMDEWGMATSRVQRDPEHPTGQVKITIIEGEPHYTISPDCAYDFIDVKAISDLNASGILYHGSLGLRNAVSRQAFMQLMLKNPQLSVFLDVNLRAPWWQKDEVYSWMKRARWVKLNQDELRLLGFSDPDIRQAMTDLQAQFQIEQLIVTRGELGALLGTNDGVFHTIKPTVVNNVVDTVGAGDAFTAIFIHGLLASWAVEDTLDIAQRFASKIIMLRGATPADMGFYEDFV